MSLLHLSLSAAEPERVARFLATLLGGRALSFPPFRESWIAFSREDDGTAIEVYPLTHRLIAGPDRIDCSIDKPDATPTFVHAAIASPLERDDIVANGNGQGWTTRICNRGPFSCIEIWLENRLLIEVLDPEMLADYRKGMTAANWSAMFGLTR